MTSGLGPESPQTRGKGGFMGKKRGIEIQNGRNEIKEWNKKFHIAEKRLRERRKRQLGLQGV